MYSARPLSSRVTPKKNNAYGGYSGKNEAQSVQALKADILRLKQEKFELSEEKKQLKVKLARMEQQKKNQNISTINETVYEKLEQEQKTLEEMIEEQKKELVKLNLSDEAAQRQELQEEAKILYLEQLRLIEERKKQKAAYEESQMALDALLERDGPEVLKQQQDKITKLNDKLYKYIKANKKLTSKLQQQRDNNANINSQYQNAVYKKKQELKQQIEEIKRETSQNRAKIEKAKEEHEILMQKLRQQAQQTASHS